LSFHIYWFLIYLQTQAKRARMGVSWNDDDTSDEEEGFADSSEDDEFASLSLEDVKSPAKGSKLVSFSLSSNRIQT
jgi:hypothetical protein